MYVYVVQDFSLGKTTDMEPRKVKSNSFISDVRTDIDFFTACLSLQREIYRKFFGK